MDFVPQGTADVTVYFRLRDSTTGLAKTGLVFNSAGAVARYTRNRGTATAITLATLAAADSTHSDGGFKEVDGTNAKGLYRLDLPDAACASGSRHVLVSLEFDGTIEETKEIQLTDPVRGLGSPTALPNAAADAAGGLPVSDAGGLDLDAQRTDVAAILVDTGTTLDGKIDTIDGIVDAILVDTAEIGVAGAGLTEAGGTGDHLTAVPWNAAWDPEVQSECADALAAYGASTLTGAAAADAVWDETLADHLGAGSTGNALNAAGSAGDPWSTALPGAYGAGTAGKIVGDNLNATVSSRASQTTADAVEADTQDIQSRLPAALTAGGNMKADALAISGDTTAADNAEKYFDGTGYGEILVRTTISAIGSQTNFGLTDGSDDNDAYNGCLLVVEDQATAAQKGVCHISDYSSTLRAVTLAEAPPFTVVAGDIVTVLARRSLVPTNRGYMLNVDTSNKAAVFFDSTNNTSIKTQAELALQSYDLDHLITTSAAGVTVANSSFLARLVSKSATPAFSSYDNTTDSLEALRDRGDAAWTTATGFALASVCTEARLAELDAANLPADVAAVNAKTTNLPASPAATGDAMTLTSGERDAVAAALLDLAAGVETNRTVRQALRIVLAALAGKLSGAATTAVSIRDTNDTKNRIVATVDADGNRSAVTLDGT